MTWPISRCSAAGCSPASTVVGSFIKTPTTHATEILGALGFDFVVIDEEHAPFDRATTDVVLLAARASKLAGIVRVSSDDPAKHPVRASTAARPACWCRMSRRARRRARVAAACRYRGGRRGYSGSPRAGGYGATPNVDDGRRAGRRRSRVIAHDRGPGSAGRDRRHRRGRRHRRLLHRPRRPHRRARREILRCPRGARAVERIGKAARAAGKPICVFVGGQAEASWLRDQGASAFVVASDQGFMRKAAAQALAESARSAHPPTSLKPTVPKPTVLKPRLPDQEYLPPGVDRETP